MSFGAFLGGALQGLGTGIAQQGQLDWKKQEEMGLEAANQAKDIAVNHAASVDQNTNAADQTARQTNSQIAVAGAQGQITQRRDAVQHGYSRSDAILQNALQQDAANNNSRNQAAIIRLQDQLKSGDINQVVVDGQGNYQIVKNDGTVQPANITAAPKDYTGSSKGGGDSLAALMAGGGANASGAAGSVPNFTSKADAEAFMNQPGNAGKPFLFNGAPKRVPK